MAKAWIYQDDKQVKKHGADKASWYVGWLDPEGKRRAKSCGAGAKGKRAAEKLRQKRQAELIEGTYQSNSKKTWKEFRQEFEKKIAVGMSSGTRRLTLESLNHFERLIKPVKLTAIKPQTIDDFTAHRRQERGRRIGDPISPATVN